MDDKIVEINLEVAKPIDVNLEKISNLAEITLKKAKILLNRASGEDSVDLVNLMNSIRSSMEVEDLESIESALNELTDLVYYLELSPP